MSRKGALHELEPLTRVLGEKSGVFRPEKRFRRTSMYNVKS